MANFIFHRALTNGIMGNATMS